MDGVTRIESALADAVLLADAVGAPPRLAAAMRHAVFPRGARVRPRLVLAVAASCGDDRPALSGAAAAAVELLHCASLVHDDMPCFDDAETRRGRPSVHRAFGEPLALLAGDALIVLAFQALARAATTAPERLPAVMMAVGDGVGVPFGIVAGQAWECEPRADLSEYQRQKTGALFAAAAMAGAAAAGREAEPWRALGEQLGEAYQVADDLRDAVSDEAEIGKPVGRDAALGRPSAVRSFGVEGAVARLRDLTAGAVAAIPCCPGQEALGALILGEMQRLLPRKLAQKAA
ncbi:polyprenyl synthetase family protein [Neoroseomonas oryzicola]|uniref:Geranylgeranyl pyrophosphate synthase n=1 Tax=Neoroseomonas oryzicola TaxID=535904 RepID=A0A9X9WF27_9PROT|nr:polyprenyl synthetase family protein [Neoroseomonas oryzicola]MBR0658937.1 geranylgeranyl pyrophosphate synthase [Neoroseomonas oryzicola]NKE19671.1 geranylgeranyl pyrophosphate synthase [Neoroseomonas oryzicola]